MSSLLGTNVLLKCWQQVRFVYDKGKEGIRAQLVYFNDAVTSKFYWFFVLCKFVDSLFPAQPLQELLQEAGPTDLARTFK
jgi:hypothetical protein